MCSANATSVNEGTRQMEGPLPGQAASSTGTQNLLAFSHFLYPLNPLNPPPSYLLLVLTVQWNQRLLSQPLRFQVLLSILKLSLLSEKQGPRGSLPPPFITPDCGFCFVLFLTQRGFPLCVFLLHPCFQCLLCVLSLCSLCCSENLKRPESKRG